MERLIIHKQDKLVATFKAEDSGISILVQFQMTCPAFNGQGATIARLDIPESTACKIADMVNNNIDIFN